MNIHPHFENTLYRFCPTLFILENIIVDLYNHKDKIAIKNVDMPLLLIIMKRKANNVHAHVHTYSSNYASFPITDNVSTVFSSLLTKNSLFQIFYYSHWNLVATESKEEVMLSLII